jgi:hypothetical protein
MSTTHIPGFTAQASLYRATEYYQQGARSNFIQAGGVIEPAKRGFPCSMCDDICAGGTGICDRWCACACRGGTHCGHPD